MVAQVIQGTGRDPSRTVQRVPEEVWLATKPRKTGLIFGLIEDTLLQGV